MNKLFYVLLTFPLITQGMNNEVKIDESFHFLEKNAKEMLSLCQSKCSLIKDVTQNCTSKCFLDFGEQFQRFIERKYTARCAGLEFNEPWKYKDDIEEQVKDLSQTNKLAFAYWQNKQIRECMSKQLTEVDRRLKQILYNANKQLSMYEEEHPILAKIINAESTIRGLGKKQQ